MNNPIKIMLVEDSAAYRKAVTCSLELKPDIEFTGQFSSAEVALRTLQNPSSRTVPDVVLLDLNLPGMSGLKAIPWFQKYVPNTQIIVLTQSNNEADILTAIEAGASGYLLKSATLNRLHDSIHAVCDGGSILDAEVARFLLDTLKKDPPKSVEKSTLTAREQEVLTLISKGLVKKEIADQLGISHRTVDVHVAHIYEKLDVPNAPSAVAKAYKTGLFASD
jgi:DNA-binding NarL/FixJ family response regulator